MTDIENREHPQLSRLQILTPKSGRTRREKKDHSQK